MRLSKRKIRRYLTNKEEDVINKKIKKLSLKAFEKARKEALKQGLSVVVKRGGGLYKIYPNGKIEFIKRVAPDVEITKRSFNISL